MTRALQTIADREWRAVEKTLPAGADLVHARNKLESIARARPSPKKLLAECEERARQCDKLVGALLKAPPSTEIQELVERLARQSETEKRQAETYWRISKNKRPHFLRQCEILWLWEICGGRISAHFRGPVVRYFQAASMVVFGKSPTGRQVKDIIRDFRRANSIELSGVGKLKVDATMMVSASTKLLGASELKADATVIPAPKES